ncbi:MAG: tetratricopeptide repeat protein [Melioribacteraceae bacterium]|nr:tetratricopeptide repeat protein [Melioribacteraceae bacterium]
MKKIIFLIFISSLVLAQSQRSLNNDGVDLYKEKKYSDAEVKFKKSLEKNNKSFHSNFNLGDAYYKQGRYDEAIQSFQNSIPLTENEKEKAAVYHNIGNALIKKNEFKDGINAYKQALKLNPNDLDTKYNLSYALNMLKQNQQKQNQQNKNDKKQDQNKNQDQQQEQNKNQDNKKEQNQQQQQQQKNQISKEEAQRILDALKNNEKDMQKKLRKVQGKVYSTDKDW